MGLGIRNFTYLEPASLVPMSGKSIRILMIDDDEEDFLIVRDMIHDIEGSSLSIAWKRSYEEGLQAMGS
jgi:hypothetical protein